MRIQALLAFVAGLDGATAAAGGLSFDIASEGRLAIGYSDRVPAADAFLTGDATLRLSLGRFGAELGVFGRADALDTPHETYGALTWDAGANGRFAIGVPRPAFDGFAVSELERHFPSLGVDRTGATRSEATFGAMFGNYLPFGVRFENANDRLRYAVSVHRNDTPDVTMAGIGVSAEFRDWVVEGAVEVSIGASTGVSGKARIHRAAGRYSGGVAYFAPGAVPGPDLLEVFGAVETVDRVTVSGVVQIPVDGSGDPTGGIAARIAIAPQLSVLVGLASDAGADPAATAFLDWSF